MVCDVKKPLVIVLSLYFSQGLIHNVGHPVTPAFVRGLDIPDYMFGVFFATMSLGLTLGAPLWGALGDAGKKRLYMAAGLLLYSVGQFAFGYVGNQYWMVFFRFLSGFGVAASMTLIVAHVVILSKPQHRAKHLGFLAAALTLGASVGYWLGGMMTEGRFFVEVLGTDDLRRVFLVQAVLNVFYAIALFFLVREPRTQQADVNKPTVFQSLGKIKNLDSNLIIFLVALSLVTIGATNLSKYIDVYFNELGYSPKDIGTFVMVTGLVSLFSSVFLVPLLVRTGKSLRVMMVIQVLSAAIVFYVFRAERFLLIVYTVYMGYVALKAAFQPLEQSFISSFADEKSHSTIMGVRQSFFSIGMVAGPLAGGFLYELKPVYVFDFSGLMFLIGFLLFIWIGWRKRDMDLSA